MAVFTIGASSIAGGGSSPTGGGVGGATNLTTVGAVPYVSASGVLNQDGSFTRVATGQYTLYDQTATTGSTLIKFRSGAGQSGPLAIFYDTGNNPVLRLGTNGEVETLTGGGTTYATQTTGNKYSVNSSGLLQFSSSSQAYDTKDTGIGRNAAGVLEVNNGTLGTLRDVYARAFRAEANTVGSLPAAAAGNAGQIQYVTDANATTIGSTVAAGGSNKVLVWSNGSAWHIMAN